MDNNTNPSPQPVAPVQPTPTPTAAAPVGAQPVPTAPPTTNNLTPTVTEVKSNGMLKWILVGVLLLVLAGAGYYYYTNFMSTPAPTASPITTTTPTTDNVAGLQGELDSITVTSIEGDFTQLDQDLSTL